MPATVVGPTAGFDTTGTEGDDVIRAPLGNQGTVLGLGGNDTIYLVDGASAPSRDPIVKVDAGPGNDSVPTCGPAGRARRAGRWRRPLRRQRLPRDRVRSQLLGAERPRHAVDNGPDSDVLFLSAAWPGDLAIDNRAGRASVGTQTALSWSAVNSFSTPVDPGSSVFLPRDQRRRRATNVSGTVLDLASAKKPR